ncbi:tape measure protein [Corynebacterium marquesiae]|uniref:tape measure protein n=1 Tax=Corynebacterium marquesiae TaxID=2913503 RepID=UPI0040427224
MSDAVWVPVNAEMKGFIGTLVKEASGAAKKGGQIVENEFAASGKRAGESMASGLQASAAKVSQVSTKLATARKAEAQAAADVGTAETKLENLRNSGSAKASELAQAEQQLETAKNKQADAAVRVSREEKNLDAARNGGQTKSTALARAEDQLANARTSQQTASAKIRTAEIQLDEARANAKTKSDAVSNAEQHLMDTRDRYGANTKQAATAERQLETAKRQAATANNQVATAEGNLRKSRSDLASANDLVSAKSLSLKATQQDVASAERRAGNEADTARGKIRGLGSDMEGASRSGGGFVSSLGRFTKRAAMAGGAFLGVSSATQALSGGFDRLNNMNRADIMFRNVGLSSAQAGETMNSLNDIVTGTNVSLADAAGTASMLMQAGVEAGKPLNDSIKALTNISAIAGGSAEDVGLVLMQIKAAGKLMGGDAMQLQQRGVNIYGYLAESLGMSFEEVKKLGEEGKISYEQVIDAINGKTGELAKEMGATLPAKLGNFKTAVSSAAAEFIEPFIGPMTSAVEGVTQKLKDAKPVIGAFADGLKNAFTWLAKHPAILGAVATGVTSLAAGAAAVKAVGIVKGIADAARGIKTAADMLKILNLTFLASPIGLIVTGITALVVGLTLFFTKTETGQKIWHGFTQALATGWDWVVEKFKAGLDWINSTFGPVFSQIGDMISGAWDATVEKVTGAVDRVKQIFSGALDFLKTGDTADYAAALGISEDSPIFTALTFFRDRIVDLKNIAVASWDFMKVKWSEFTTGFGQFYQTWIAPVIDFIGTAFGALKDVAVAAWDLMKAKWEEFTIGFGQFYQTWIAPGVNLLVTIFGVLRDAAVAGWQLMQQKWQEFTQLFVEFYQAWIVPIIDAMQMGFQMLGSVVSAAFNGIWTAIQFVGSVISAVWSGIIQPILSLFMSVAQAVGTFVASVFTAVIGGSFRVMGSVISSIWNGVIKPTWDFFRNAAGLLADVLTGNFSNIRNRFSSMGQAISNIVHGVINSAMNFFRSIFENAKQVAASFGQAIGRMVGTVRGKIGEMMGVLGQIPGKVQGVFASAGSWLVNAGKNIISGLINGIKSMFGQVENAIGSVMPDKIRGMLGFMDGGVYMAQGGITRAYIDGGIDKLERYANGGSKEKHTAQIAKGGEWRIWAEPETGGESYIPLAKSKRKRSTQILAKTADIFGLSVVDKKGDPVKPGTSSQVAPAAAQYFANGGITVKSLRDFVEGRPANGHQAARSLEGAPYVWGGSNWGDCSGAMSAVAAFAAGISPFPRKFATGNEAAWLSSHGFRHGRGKQGDLRIGFKNGGPAGGHTAGTLPDGTNIEMGGGRGNGQIGGRAAGAWDSYFNEFFYKTIKPPKPPKMNKILDQNAIPDGSTMTIDGVPVTVSADESTTGSTGENTVTVALSPEDAAKATAAKGLGDQSILDFAVDGIFDMLGMKDSTIKKLLTTKGKDMLPSGDSIVTTQQVKEQPRTNVAAKNAQAIESDAVASMPEAKMAKDPQLAAPKPKKQTPKWGEPFFAHEIARSAKDHKLDVNGAKIGMAVALVESGSPLKMWANRAVPESLKYRHDAVGSDYDSVGLFQQRDNGAWGTVKQRMTPYDSAGMFFDAMLRKYPNWRGMEPGAVAQGVQVSAFPDRYAGQMGRGLQLAKRSGVFDQGGLGYGKGLLPKDIVEPERVLSPQQTRAFDDLVYKEMPKQRDGGAGTTVVINLDGQEVLRQRVDKVEGELNINTEELGRLRRRTSVAVAGTTRGGAM